MSPLPLRHHYQSFGNVQRKLRAVVLPDQGQGQVDAGCHTGRVDQPGIAHIDRIGFDLGRWKGVRQLLRILPMRRDALTIVAIQRGPE